MNWVESELAGNNTLLISAGESWTWGDSIPPEKRWTSIYGYRLSQMLGSDFINVSRCGAANIEIHDNLLRVIEDVNKKYDKIYVIVTLTELCREANWDKIWVPTNASTLEEFLCQYEKNMLNSINSNLINAYPEIKFIFARNFTYTFDENTQIVNSLLTTTWVDILAKYQDKLTYPQDVRILSSIGYVPLHKLLREINLYNKWKFQFMEYYASAEMAVTWLENSSLNYQKATKHPTELGHELWAQFLYDKFKQGESNEAKTDRQGT